MKSKYTPGPWEVDPIGTGAKWNIETADGIIPIALASEVSANDSRRNGGAIRTANANLIAAAPELLEALEGSICPKYVIDTYYKRIIHHESECEWCKKKHKAISKAKGQTND